ncbi:hypothetical protein L249_3377 [Ophiocordyceps polyrhachis-furcata BCC 54312]|uniref:Molybdenum cofactor sulfurase n=1 Tax=Ophiocordyceps polyrhachis-furcata BCC 54312 TaxID=1330021 RepID=A0A367LML6_9HYPO|nr:hypothetical protein L249_3377 [Ophiocordyceps polyrhachis-furcata BCC 54312]
MASLDGYDAAIEAMRPHEYPMLEGCVHLDHAGSTPGSRSLMDAFAVEMTSTLYGNPHSASTPSQLAASRIDDIRLRLLTFFGADASDYDLVFVANATAGVKLVVEAMRALPRGYAYAYHQYCHTSLVGAREDARFSACLSDAQVLSWLDGADPFPPVEPIGAPPSATLFSYPAQSHMDGRRYPLSWAEKLREQHLSPFYTLLDAASLAATSPLHLSSPEFAADFIVLSLYKIFGFPEIGVLIVRRAVGDVFNHRRYFGGGTVDLVICAEEQWHAPKTQALHERLEDGTLPFQNIVAAGIALDVHQRLFGSPDMVSAHTSHLARRLRRGLCSLRHRNGRHVCVVYTPPLGAGPIVTFNLVDDAGGWVSLVEFEKLAGLRRIHVRTGSLCCPGGVASAIGFEPWELKRNLSAGFRCGTESDVDTDKPMGVIRASLGAMNTASDVEKLIDFIKEFFVDVPLPNGCLATADCTWSTLRVKTLTVYPIKSCGGIVIPPGRGWEVKPEGLAWDREWCLVHRGSGQALSQKRYPSMALLLPSLDMERGVLRVERGGTHQGVDIPLSTDAALFYNQTPSSVCGEPVYAQTYASDEINSFFANALGVPCVLARFPAGGRGLGCRTSKARPQKHQLQMQGLPGSFPDTPPASDSDSEQGRDRILLSNESPMLLVHSASVDALNGDIVKSRGGDGRVSESCFRANVVVGALAGGVGEPAYSEDWWSFVVIGGHRFRLLGACRRCQMVCVDQRTAERRQEPLTTLAKTRRFDGKVLFGAHMRLEPGERQGRATVQVGDSVIVCRNNAEG